MRWLACGLLALGALGLAQPASAQTSPQSLVDGNFIDVGDATITLVDCGAFCGSLIQFAAAPGPNVGFVIESATDPGVDAFLTHGEDLTVSFEIATTVQDITSIGLSATGTGNGSVGETVYDNLGCVINNGSPTVGVGSTTKVGLTYGAAMGCISTDERDVFVTKDIAANAGSVVSVTQYLDAVGAPEPFSSAVFAVGLLGLAAARRRAR